MSLRTFHVIFVLGSIILTELFGAWAFWRNAHQPDHSLVVAGTISLIAGFCAIIYAIWFVRKADRAHLE